MAAMTALPVPDQELRREGTPAPKRALLVEPGCPQPAFLGRAGPSADAGPALAVGIGIATGPAFVGNIQSSDRFIWTVIGDTVNLAARLQSSAQPETVHALPL